MLLKVKVWVRIQAGASVLLAPQTSLSGPGPSLPGAPMSAVDNDGMQMLRTHIDSVRFSFSSKKKAYLIEGSFNQQIHSFFKYPYLKVMLCIRE